MTGTWPSGFSDGDIIVASEYKKQVGSIYDTTLGGAAASIDVTGIVAAYAHLMVTIYARGDTAATNVAVLMRLNGDTAANYDFQLLQGNAAAGSAAEVFAATAGSVALCPAATAGANLFNSAQVFIPHYAGSTNNKQYVSISGVKTATTTGTMFVHVYGGSWRSNAAVNRITLLPNGGNFAAGTRVTIDAMGA